ncbi:type II toxin-antitoxin system VapC family toxin [Brevundimonas goettingensis]|uniref:Type II toxin-antitoxin system VapC family toxin n=1 Tax=Brevundimonas goettingensis TaxID=2774190 RepID=A0A975C2X7_9CAUL|nr:type II toxin-antitoxin system VapC family toxin [Brevundimonas goettingensis]QTC91877.1 type II toxin-antitoxin system VapC family toxin [Brevundimonas goettingensis]
MRLLLDANIVIWLLSAPARVRETVRDQIRSEDNAVFVSTASLLEITAKAATGRLNFTAGMLADLQTISTWLPVEAEHALLVQNLPPIHKDPFDRIIVAQAMVEEMTLVTGDRILLEYGVSVLLA